LDLLYGVARTAWSDKTGTDHATFSRCAGSEMNGRRELQLAQTQPEPAFSVSGTSDTAGLYQHNVDLSQRRAQAT
jgi:hypothetical protein